MQIQLKAVLICTFLFLAINLVECQTVDEDNNNNNSSSIEVKLQPGESRISFRLSARNLPVVRIDPFNGFPDPYVVVFESYGNDWSFLTQTAPIVDTRNPNWMEIINGRYVLNSGKKWRFDILDYDPVGADEYIGQVILRIDEFFNATADFIAKPLQPPGSGTLVLYKYN